MEKYREEGKRNGKMLIKRSHREENPAQKLKY